MTFIYSFIPPTTLWVKYYYPYITDKETVAEKYGITCSMSFASK